MSGIGLRGFEPLLRGADLDGAVILCESPVAQERTALCWQFVKEGLAADEKALIVLAQVQLDEMKEGLGKLGVAFDDESEKGNLQFLNWIEIAKADRVGGTLRLPSLIHLKFTEMGINVKKRVLLVGFERLLSALQPDARTEFVASLVGEVRSGATLGMVFIDPSEMEESYLETLRKPFDGILRITHDSLGQGLMIGVHAFEGAERTGIFLPISKAGDEYVAGLAAMKGPASEACPECGFRVLPGFDVCPRCKTELKRAKASAPPGAPSVFDYLEKLRIESGLGEPVDTAGKEDDLRKKKLEEFLQSIGVVEEKEKEIAKQRLRAIARSRSAPRKAPKGPGRTNGLTNGLTRDTGMVNGLAKGTGLVNGLSRTTGKVNGTGRTNGLVNGLRKARKGMTNGLTNGNGFTNGLGSKKFQKQTSHSRWKILIIPVIAAILLFTPIMMPASLFEPVFTLDADGSFGEWSGAISLDRNTSLETSIDLIQGGVLSEMDRLGVYFEVAGTVLTGKPSGDSSDLFEAYLDTDSDATTGYSVKGMGADYLLQIFGQGRKALRMGLYAWTQRASQSNLDWSNWHREWPVRVAVGSGVDSGKMEATIDVYSSPTKDAAFIASGNILLHSQSWDNKEDYSDFSISETRPSLQVVQTSVAPVISSPGDIPLLELKLRTKSGSILVDGIDFAVEGTASANSISTFSVRDEGGNILGSQIYGGGSGHIVLSAPMSVDSGWKKLTLEATVVASSGATLGLRLTNPYSVKAPGAAISLMDGKAAIGKTYLGFVPAGVVIDGAFSDWMGATSHPGGGSSTKGVKSIDIRGYDAHRDGSSVSLYVRVDGSVLDGTIAPVRLPSSAQVPPVTDSDFDTVPDSVEIAFNNVLPFDFNNDNVSDAMSGHDVDGDGVQDRPWGPDFWLNTTIPSWYGSPYAGRVISLYIGPELPPASVIGQDTLRIFLDTDEVPGSGYWVKGIYADRMVEITGKNGVPIGNRLLRFNGPTPFTWGWEDVGVAVLGLGSSELEARVDLPILPPAVNVTAVFDMRSWRGAWDDTSPTGTRSMTRSADGTLSIKRELYTVDFPESSLDGGTTFRDLQGLGLEWQLLSLDFYSDGTRVESRQLPPSYSVMSGVDVLYKAASSDVLVKYSAESYQLKEEIIIPQPLQLLSEDIDEIAVEFDVTYANGVTPAFAESAGSWVSNGDATYYVAPGGIRFQIGGLPAFSMAPAFAFDAGGAKVGCRYTVFDGVGRANIRIGCPADWLSSAEYPVAIDPTILMNGYRGENFGYSLATGDFNGDGKSDLLVGAPYNNLIGSGIGRAYVYLGGATMNNVVDLEMPGLSAGSHFGWSVAAGDLNNDGYSDMIIGAPDYNSGDGRVYVNMGASTLNAVVDYTIVARQIGEKFGYSLAVGNFDGDSYKDILVGAPLNDTGGTDVGSAYIYLGGSTFNVAVDKILHGANNGEQFGYSVGVGNFNNDAYEDAAVGAPKYVVSPSLSDGRVSIYFGAADMDTVEDVNCNNGNNNEEVGTSVTSADYNNDGYGDLYAGGPKYSTSQGRVTVYYGGASMNGGADAYLSGPAANSYYGMALTNGMIGVDARKEVVIGSPRYTVGGSPLERGRFDLFWNGTSGSFLTRNGDNDYDHFAYAVAIGDLNSSSTFGELAVGAIHFDVADNTSSGKVYIFNGGNPGGMDTTPDLQMVSKDTGSREGERLGYSLATGDFNGDGKQDVLSGAPFNSNGGADTGAAFIFFGKPFEQGYYGPDLMLPGQYAGERFGWNVSTGDVNADGYDDALIGAPYNDEGGTDIGRAYIFYGGSSMNTVVDIDIAGQSSGELFGWDVASGNMNGDQAAGKALDDMVIGAPQNGSGKGRVYIFFGSTSLASTLSTPNVKLYRGDSEAFGSSVAVGNFNRDAYEDLIIGAPLNDTASTDIGAAYIYNGCGNWGDCFRDPDNGFTYIARVSSIGSLDNTGDLLADAQYDDAINENNPPTGVAQGDQWYTADKGARMHFATTDVSGIVFGTVIAAKIQVQYSVEDGYAGTNSTMWKYSGSGWAYTTIQPVNAEFGVIKTYDIFSLGVNTKAKVGSVQNYFENNDPGGADAVSFDYVWVNITLRGQQPANITLKGQVNQERFGHSVETGDFDGDSNSNYPTDYLDDVAVGAPFWYDSTNDTGVVYIFSGSTIRATPNGGSINTPTRQINSPSGTSAKFGWSLAAGNITGDDYDDLVVGAPLNDSGMGAVTFFFGPTASMKKEFISSGEQNERRGWALAVADLVTGYYGEATMGGPRWNGTSLDGRVVILTSVPEFSDAVLPIIASLAIGFVIGRRRLRRRI